MSDIGTAGLGVDIQRSVEPADGHEQVTLTLTATGQVPVLVRFFDDVPEGQAVLGDRTSDDETPETYAFDRLECHQVLTPGEQTVVTYTLTAPAPDETLEDGDGAQTTGGNESSGNATAPSVEVAAVVPLTSDQTGMVDPVVVWWAGEEAYRVPTTDGETRHVGPGASDSPFVSDGGNVDLTADASAAEATAVPAVGIVATAADDEAVVRTVTRARARGHEVYVTYDTEASEPAARLGEDLGAVVVDPPRPGMGRAGLRSLLVDRAEADGHVGVIIQPVGATPIDYDRTARAAAKSGFSAAAIPQSWAADPTHPHVVVAIPAYNAADTVGDVVRRAEPYADLVVVVDDGSDDDTGAVAREAGAYVVEHRRNRGYGGALKTAFREADRLEADHLVVLDADGQHEPADIPRLVEAQKVAEAEIVIGSRYAPESMTELPLFRRVGLTVVNVLTNLSLGHVRPRDYVYDTQSGFRAYDRDAVESLTADPDIGDRMSASTDIIYHAHQNRYRIHEVGTTIRYDVPHSSTLNPIAHGYDLVRNIFYTLTVVHPIKTIGVVGGVMSALGIGVTLEGLALGIEGGEVPFVKTYAAALVMLFGIVLVLFTVEHQTIRSHPYYRRGR